MLLYAAPKLLYFVGKINSPEQLQRNERIMQNIALSSNDQAVECQNIQYVM